MREKKNHVSKEFYSLFIIKHEIIVNKREFVNKILC